MNDVSNVNKNAKIAVAAPRGHAKSSYLSKAFPLHELLYRRRKYTILISETPKVAKGNLDWIRDQVKYNRKLREDFGPLLSPKDQSNIQDNNEGFIAWLPDGEFKKQIALIESASVGGAIRGRNWNQTRPDLIICDDLEDARPGGNASTPEQRASLRDWFTQSAIPLGDPKGKRTAFIYMGTTVHADALLMQVMYKRSDFRTRLYRALIKEPVRTDLWEQCRKIHDDRENETRGADARAFYCANFEAMNEGSEVLWEEGKPLWELMTWKWNNGSKAFNTEYQNNPIDPETMIFNPENFTYHNDNIDSLSDRYDVANGVDFAMGKKTRGDYSAIATVARDKITGTIYVVDMFGARIKPDEFIDENVTNVLRNQPTSIGAEAVAAQEFFVDELKKALTKAGYPAETRVKKIYHRSRKELRIEAMLPMIENGTIQFSHQHKLLLEQFEQYGTGAHDDLIDALEMAISTLKKGSRRKAGNAGNYRY
ncbi:hypothetical protein C6356_00595 [Bacillus wiedmannii]|nr:hypothetical protein C6356_00595 [Bacillus wiedmannii]